MIILLRALGRLVTFALLVVLALAGLAVAIFSIGADDNAVSLPALARYLHLPELRDVVGDWLGMLETGGPTAWWSVLGGAVALLVGLTLLFTYLFPHRERLVTLAENDAGRLASRRRPLAQAATTLTEQERGILEAKVRVRTRRWGRGSLSVRASRPRSASQADVEARAGQAVGTLAQEFGLRTRVRSRIGARVE
jgi:hypothetical protein